jgi:hypothetical protein
MYGVFLLFLNYIYTRLEDSFWLVSADYTVENIDHKTDWKIFEKEIDEARMKGTDSRLSNDFKEKFGKAFTVPVGRKIIDFINQNDMIQLNHVFAKYLQDSVGLQRLEIDFDIQQISSLDMELLSISSQKLAKKIVEGLDKKKAEAKKAEEAAGNRPPEAGKNGVKMIIHSALILSPIKGKHISMLTIGDRIMTTLVDSHPQTIEIAKAFNAYDSEKKRISPISGRIKYMKYTDGFGYDIYAVIAKGILVHIQEEENNIKVRMDPSYMLAQQQDDEETSKPRMPMIIGLLAAVIILTVVIVLIVFK